MTGVHAGRLHTIDRAELILGRSEAADLRIDDTGVSRTHAKLTHSRDGVVTILDLGSKNGLAVNGRRIDVAVLRSGDRIMLGPVVELRFGSIEAGRNSSIEQRERALEELRARLTARQLQIAKLVARGLSNKEIGGLLELRVRSVESHLDRIYARLDINSRASLTRIVVEAGLR